MIEDKPDGRKRTPSQLADDAVTVVYYVADMDRMVTARMVVLSPLACGPVCLESEIAAAK